MKLCLQNKGKVNEDGSMVEVLASWPDFDSWDPKSKTEPTASRWSSFPRVGFLQNHRLDQTRGKQPEKGDEASQQSYMNTRAVRVSYGIPPCPQCSGIHYISSHCKRKVQTIRSSVLLRACDQSGLHCKVHTSPQYPKETLFLSKLKPKTPYLWLC